MNKWKKQNDKLFLIGFDSWKKIYKVNLKKKNRYTLPPMQLHQYVQDQKLLNGTFRVGKKKKGTYRFRIILLRRN